MKETKFKQTEVGMIPSDWEVKTIGSFCKVYDGTHQTPNYVDFGIPFYSVENVSADDFEHTKYISLKEYTQISKRANIVKGDILMTRIGSIGVCKYVDWNCKAGFYVSLALLKCNDSVDARFICHLSNSENFKREIELHSLLTAIPQKINLGPISNVRIALPPTIEEQQRIANALSDVDSLINNLEKLIAKKKNIKQGAMQQLLTGKKRLPGFGSDERRKECHSERSAKREAEKSSGYKMTELGLIPSDWENVNISKTCTIKARIGWQGLKSTEYLNSGDYILVTGTDFKNGFIDWSTCSYVSEWRFKQDKNIQIKKGDVLVTKDGTIGKVAFLNEIPMEGTLNSGVFVVRSKDLKKIDSVYLSLVFKSSWFDNFLDEITSGSTIVHLYQKDFVKFNFPIPSSIEEQTAIANVLSDMDTEISALETKLAKYRKLKTGMMQQLLTGKIRLV